VSKHQGNRTATEPSKVSLHIFMTATKYERVKKFARYATVEGIIEGHPRGSFSEYCNLCFNLGGNYIKQYMLRKAGLQIRAVTRG